MQVQKAKRLPQASSNVRQVAVRRRDRSRKNGSAKTGINADGCLGIGLHLLTKQLRQIPLFEAAMLTGIDYRDDGDIITIIDTEAKQLQAIEDLYLIIKAQPKYKKLKEPEWNENSKPVEVLYWLLRKLGPLAEGNFWTVDTYQEGKKTRFRFIIYRHYHAQLVRPDEQYLPLDFLPFLKKRDQPLHDMWIDLVALISKENKVPLWDEDGDFSVALHTFLQQPVRDNGVLQNQYLSYSNGPAAEYLKLIKQRRRIITAEIVQEQLSAYNDDSERKRSIVWWIEKGIKLSWYKQSILKNTFIPNYIKGNPRSPFRNYKFVWSLHDNDILKVKAYAILSKDGRQAGDFLPVEFSSVKLGQKLKPIERDEYPERLCDFMRDGKAFLLWRFRDYFYKNQFDDQKTQSEQLLEKIEQMEIKNSGR